MWFGEENRGNGGKAIERGQWVSIYSILFAICTEKN
jgi:hypothetical protein